MLEAVEQTNADVLNDILRSIYDASWHLSPEAEDKALEAADAIIDAITIEATNE